jgi:hypothetical protein
MIEHILYRGVDNQKADTGGRKGFAKLEQYLKTRGITHMPTENYYYFEPKSGFNPSAWFGSSNVPRMGSKLRMQQSFQHTSGYLGKDLDPRITHIKTERF